MVKSILTLLTIRQSNILSGASILMVAVFASKFLGLIRDRLMVDNFNTDQAAIFFAAFKIPDLIFQLLIFGTLSVAFIPVFTDTLSKKGEKEAFGFASNILNLSLFVFGVVSIFVFLFTPQLNGLIVPGFVGQQKILTDYLTRIVIFSELILVIGTFFIGISQSYQRFIMPALAPLFYNVGIIIGILVLAPIFGIAGPAFGVIIGAMLHVAVQIPLVNSLGFKYRLSLNFFDSAVREVFRMMSIRNIGLAIELINDTISFALATLISNASPTILTLAQHLYVVPIGLFGATIAQAALPVLSREQSKGETQSFKFTLLTTMHQILFLTLPALAILVVLRIPIVRLVYGASHFSWTDTVLTGRSVAFFSLGLVSQAVILLLIRGFYSLKDTKTPVIVSLITVSINIGLSLFFVQVLKLGVWSLGLAYSVTSNVSFVLLLYFLDRKVGGFELKPLVLPAFKMFLAAILAAIALYIPIKALDQLVFDTTKTINLIILTGIASFVGLSIYLILVWLMKIKELYTFVDLVKRISNFQVKIESKQIPEEPESI